MARLAEEDDLGVADALEQRSQFRILDRSERLGDLPEQRGNRRGAAGDPGSRSAHE
jgi:hypothetical protein